jgi:hypothetical protein
MIFAIAKIRANFCAILDALIGFTPLWHMNNAWSAHEIGRRRLVAIVAGNGGRRQSRYCRSRQGDAEDPFHRRAISRMM